MPFTQEQAIALLSLLSEGKLISELTELLTLDTDNNFVAINSGSNDAKKIKIPLLRGYKGTYNASTNTPSLSNTVGLEGDMYVVSVAGSRDFGAGTVNLLVDDIIIYLNGKYLKTNGIVTGSLDLQGAYNNSSPKTITVADSTDGTLTVKDSATNNKRDEILQVQDTSGNILFYVQRDKVYIKDNLGIGTENPTEKLEVAGNIKSSGDIKLDKTKKIIFDTDDNQESTILYNTSNTSLDYSTDSKHRFIDNIGQLFTVEANLISLSGSVKTDEITTYNDNTNLELSAHGTGKVYVNDDLGVGTSTPSEKLEVAGNVKITGDQTINGKLIVKEDSFDTLRLKRGVSGSTTIIMEDSNQNGAHIQSRSTGGLNLSTFINNVNADALSIDQNQNLGIGTTTPSEKLEVKGRIYINPDAQFSGTVDPASAMLFKSKNGVAQTSTVQMIATTTSQDQARMTFKVQSAASSFNSALIISCDSGEVTTRVPVKFDADKTICFSGTSRTYNDLPSSPTAGTISYITDADSSSVNFAWRGVVTTTTTVSNQRTVLVFYDGTNWVYH